MVKKLLSMIIVIGVLLSASIQPDIVYAQNEIVYVISPMSLYTQYACTTLNITSGVAYVNATIIGYSGSTTSVSITMYLEKKFLWWWNTQETWTQTYTGSTGALSGTLSVAGGTYRARTVFIAYSGSNSETTIVISSEIVN